MTDWSEARCIKMGELFFSEKKSNIEKAKQICEQCPIKRACLMEALRNKEAWGVWGGHDYEELRVLALQLGYEPPTRKIVEHGTERGWAWHRRQKQKDPNHQICEECVNAYNMNVRVRVARYRKRKNEQRPL